jgi:hypothetical protein
MLIFPYELLGAANEVARTSQKLTCLAQKPLVTRNVLAGQQSQLPHIAVGLTFVHKLRTPPVCSGSLPLQLAFRLKLPRAIETQVLVVETSLVSHGQHSVP